MTTAPAKQSTLQKIEQRAVSFLKAAEHDCAVVIEGAAVAQKVAPAAEAGAAALGYPEVAIAIQKIVSIIVGSGAIVNTATNGTGTGADKLAVAAPQVEALIKSSGVFGAAAIADVNKYDNAIKVITGGFADLVDSHALSLSAPAQPAAPPPAASAASPSAVAAPSAQETLAGVIARQ